MNTKMMSMAVFAALVMMMSSLSVYAGGPDGDTDRSAQWKERIEARKQEIFRELNLTDEQKQKLEENRKTHRDDAKDLFKNMKELRTAMRQELEKESLDMARINQIQSQIKDANEQMMDNRLQGILEVRGVLTPEQFKKFSAKMHEHREHSMNMRWDKKDENVASPEGAPEMVPPDGLPVDAGK